ncbi:M56 family metallopeptidase [Flavobacterium sp. LHD-80]|uniref:M56 family metallopeptidase n=1 Tax=Flavobacterium sp. LHD-80 TaxID=3071411 RepID=UPI0027DEC67B|nr:M56 family metallopeptidase [Flavobacterium sp. LHD-80]MDQ6470305.1 M56 family metallopeptidase [Flavobacterium sp. LHD-80]
MMDFLYKSSLSLFVLLIVYHLVLERQKMHKFNRFYLLFSFVFSLILPFITIEVVTETQQTYKYFVQNIPIQSKVIVVQSIDYVSLLLWGFYGLVTLVLIFRFVRNILKIVSKVKSNEIVVYKNANLVLVDAPTQPHTFLNYIFLNKTDYQNRKIEAELYSHELIHVAQKHTLDILFVEVLKTVFWFNPLFIFYKKAIQLNHEFLADENVVTSFNDVPFYQNLLLAHANTNPISGLTSNLNYSVIKKRFIMMTKSVSKTKILLSKMMLLPLFSGLVFFVCTKSVAQSSKADNEVYASNQIAENSSSSGSKWKVGAGKNENVATKRPEIMMSSGYNLAGMKVNQPALQSAIGKLSNYILNNYKSPEGIDKKDEIASITFLFGKDGSLENIKAVNGNGEETETEILRILKSSPKFLPSENYGKADWKPISVKMDFWPINAEEMKTAVASEQTQKMPGKETTAIVNEIDKQPEFPGGILEFYKFVGKNFKVPAEAGSTKIQGKIYMEFMIETDGSLSEFNIVKDLGFGMGDEAIRVLKLSPKWSPGTHNGQPVRVLYKLPITVQSAP